MTDVGTTKRKPLTPTQRLKLFEDHKGICYICGLKINGKFVDEHIRPLALGGSNDLSNRRPVHVACAAAKTNGPQGDLATAAKAKRSKMAALGIVKDKPKIQSRGFIKYEKPERIEKTPLPPRRMFEDE